MKATETAPRTAAPARLPDHEKLTRLVARSLGVDAHTLRQGLQPAGMADLPDIVALRQAHLRIRWDDAAYLGWRYALGRPQTGFGDLWRLRVQGRIVAIIGVENLLLALHGQTHAGGQVMDLLIDPDAQESGLGIWLNQAMLARHRFTLAVGANHNSAGIVRRMFERLPPRLTLTHPLDLAPFVRRRWPSLASLPLAVRLANGGLALWRLALRRHRPSGLDMESVTQLDPSMAVPASRDDVGSAGSAQLQHNSAYLQRRLLGNPRRKMALRLARREGAAVGLIAWSLGVDDLGRPELHVVDWHHDNEASLLALLHEALREAAAQGCTCVRMNVQDRSEQAVAARAGFLPSHGDEGRLCGVQSNDPALAGQLAQARWRLTDASDDGDAL